VAHKDNGTPGAGDVFHFAKAFFLKIDVADGENFIYQKN
jgi:hypothetical protein